MENDKNLQGSTTYAPEYMNSEKQELGHLSRFLNIIISPRKAFEDIDRVPKIAVPLLTIVLITILASILTFGAQVEIVQEALLNNMTESGKAIPADGLAGLAKVSAGIGIFIAGWMQILMIIIVTAVVRGIATFLDGEGTFGRLFSMFLYASLITVLGLGIVNFVSVGLNVSNFNVSLAAFLPETAPTSLKVILQSFSVFNIWYLAIVSIGISVVERLSMAKSVACALAPQLILLGISLLVI